MAIDCGNERGVERFAVGVRRAAFADLVQPRADDVGGAVLALLLQGDPGFVDQVGKVEVEGQSGWVYDNLWASLWRGTG